ncbi:NUDIX hydrolase [Paenibacillus dokdonensis]|uniref:NUDIX hydrolase n=1 Tax=Paenibacillus dokdonensis TaxID=2567944 RepID=UPI0010A91431|nr:8-oxo-dGTP diphosphatase [Paenibacillus dokdonensis]
MIAFTICFIKKGDRILLLNRNKSSWMGMWNGVGGKLEPGETPRESMLREIMEETGIVPERLHFKGLVTWLTESRKTGGMYTYMAELPEEFHYPTPIQTDEGILDWKELEWILHPDNRGIVYNIPKSLEKILFDEHCYDHTCTYQNGELVRHDSVRIEPDIENITDANLLEERICRDFKLVN